MFIAREHSEIAADDTLSRSRNATPEPSIRRLSSERAAQSKPVVTVAQASGCSLSAAQMKAVSTGVQHRVT